jgi:hypothetical protein
MTGGECHVASRADNFSDVPSCTLTPRQRFNAALERRRLVGRVPRPRRPGPDGNIVPILDDLRDAGPHALHSRDPQGGVDMADIRQRCGRQVCLIGNGNCGMRDTGTDDEVIASARYALGRGMPGGGYVFSTSNCIYTGMRLRRYELMLDVWRREGHYPA